MKVSREYHSQFLLSLPLSPSVGSSQLLLWKLATTSSYIRTSAKKHTRMPVMKNDLSLFRTHLTRIRGVQHIQNVSASVWAYRKPFISLHQLLKEVFHRCLKKKPNRFRFHTALWRFIWRNLSVLENLITVALGIWDDEWSWTFFGFDTRCKTSSKHHRSIDSNVVV